MGSGLGINSQSRRKRPKNSLQSQLRGCSTPPWAGQLEGNNAQSCSSQSSGQAPALPQPQPQPWSCCQQSLTVTPETFLGAFPECFPGLVPGKLLWQSGSGSAASPGHGECPPALISEQFSSVQPEPGLILWGCCSLILICSLQELQGRQPWFPGSSLRPWHSFLVCPFGQRDTERGEKLQQWLRE